MMANISTWQNRLVVVVMLIHRFRPKKGLCEYTLSLRAYYIQEISHNDVFLRAVIIQ